MCTNCRQSIIQKAVIEKLRSRLETTATRQAKDHADQGFDCCDSTEIALLHAIWRGLEQLGVVKEPALDTDEIYNRVYAEERKRLGYG